MIRTAILVFSIATLSCNKTGFNETTQQNSQDSINDREASGKFQNTDSLKAACNDSMQAQSIKEFNTSISYPQRDNCSWNAGGNLGPVDKFIQARETSPGQITVPPNSAICEISLDSKGGASMHYDDFLFLSLENHIIFGSNEIATALLEKSSRGYKWDFSRLVGQEIANFEADYYCIADKGNCVIPPHDQVGPISLKLTPEDIAHIAVEQGGKTRLSMNLIATGDNDEKDCMHTDLDLHINIKYIGP